MLLGTPGVAAMNATSFGCGYAGQLSEFSGFFPGIDAKPREDRRNAERR